MNKLYLLLLLLLTTIGLNAQTTLWQQDFETDGAGYFLSNASATGGAECSDGASDFVTRTDGSNISSGYDVGNTAGNFYFAIQDLDAEAACGFNDGPDQVIMTFMNDISIAGHNTLKFSLDIAEDDDGSNQDWDDIDFFEVQYDIDNSGSWTTLILIGSTSSGFNSEPEFKLPAVLAGTKITDVFTNYEVDIAGTGAVIDLRIVVTKLDSGDEDVAFDNLTLTGIAAGANPLVSLSADATSGSEDATTVVTLTATATSAVSGVQTVDVAVAGVGIAATDYTLSGTSISIADGATTGSVTFTIVDDADNEGDETATITISNPSAGVDLGAPTSVDVTIEDNDNPQILVSDTFINGLTYVEGSGPSADYLPLPTIGWENFQIGAGATASNPINNFEFSADGVTYVTLSSVLSGIPGLPNLPPVPVYVRMIAGLTAGSYSESVTLNGGPGAAPVTINFEGEVTPAPAAPCTVLFISEYGEPSSGNGKYVEIYNPSAAAIDLAPYVLTKHTNGGSGSSSSIDLVGSIPANGVWVIGNNATDVPSSNQTSTSVVNFNGDDVVELYNGAVMIDAVGVNTGSDPGDGWEVAGVTDATANNTLIRKASIQGPNNDWATSAGTDALDSEWTVVAYSQANLGTHSSDCHATTCSIDNIAAGVQTACNPVDNTYTQEITVTYTDAPASGDLVVNGQSFAITTSPQTVTLTGLVADGQAVDVDASFSDDLGCSSTALELFAAPADCTPVLADCSELFFSQYIEGSSNNKCLEIYNPTGTAIDMAAGNYTVVLYGNGNTSPSGTFPLSGTIPAYGTFTFCNSGADPAFTANADVVGGSLNAATFYNGNDVVTLESNGSLVDAIGQIGNSANFASNVTIIRNPNILVGDNNGDDAFDLTDWMVLPQDDASNLGVHANECNPTPLIANDIVCNAATMQVGQFDGGYGTYSFFGGLNCKTVIGNNELATAANDPMPSCGTGGRSLWYAFTTPGCDVTGSSPYSIRISTDNPGTDAGLNTILDVFGSSDGTCAGTFTSLACNDDKTEDGCGGNASTETSTLEVSSLMPATTYYLRVDGVDGSFGTFELSIDVVMEAPAMSIDAASGKMQITTEDHGADLYSYYWRPVGYSGYSFKNTASNTYLANVAPGNTFEVQTMDRCGTVRFRTPVATFDYPGSPACSPITISCEETLDETSIAVSWNEVSGLYTGAGGGLSGYQVFYNEVGTPGYNFISNPIPTCSGGVCTYEITGLNPFASYDVWVKTRCTQTIQVSSNTVTCSPGQSMPARGEESLYSFNVGDVHYVDVQLSDPVWNGFGVKIPETGSGSIDFSNGTAEVYAKEGISTMNKSDNFTFNLVPNPTQGDAQIMLHNNAKNALYKVYDVQGKLLLESNIEDGTNNVNINTNNLNKGVYIVTVVSGDKVATQKLIVAK